MRYPVLIFFFETLFRVAWQVHKLARVEGFSVYWRTDDKERWVAALQAFFVL